MYGLLPQQTGHTNCDKDREFQAGSLFQLNVVLLHIPPLSERKDDIPLLSYYFLKKYSALMKKNIRKYPLM